MWKSWTPFHFILCLSMFRVGSLMALPSPFSIKSFTLEVYCSLIKRTMLFYLCPQKSRSHYLLSLSLVWKFLMVSFSFELIKLLLWESFLIASYLVLVCLQAALISMIRGSCVWLLLREYFGPFWRMVNSKSDRLIINALIFNCKDRIPKLANDKCFDI